VGRITRFGIRPRTRRCGAGELYRAQGGLDESQYLAHVPAKHALGLDPRVGTGSPIRTCANKNLPRSRDIGCRMLGLLRGERVEIDEMRIVVGGIAVLPAAMNVHQGLNPPGIEIVHMLMPQRHR
jgi:hypothetical protein